MYNKYSRLTEIHRQQLLTRISCHWGILLGGYRHVQYYIPSLPFINFSFMLCNFLLLFKGTHIFLFLLQVREFSLTPYAPAPAPAPTPAPTHAPTDVPASAPASGSADLTHSHGLEPSEEVHIVSSLDEWLQQPAEIDIEEVYQAPHLSLFF
jgi:hypothetical protein